MKILSSLIIAMMVFAMPGIAQQMTQSNLVGAWSTPGSGQEKRMLLLNADGTYADLAVDKWKVTGDTMHFGFFGTHKFKLQSDGQAFTVFEAGSDTAVLLTFKRLADVGQGAGAAASGLVGSWLTGPKEEMQKLVVNADSTFSWSFTQEPTSKWKPTWKLWGDTLNPFGMGLFLVKLQKNGQEMVLQSFAPRPIGTNNGILIPDTTVNGTRTYLRVRP